jgi:hypothetical protein
LRSPAEIMPRMTGISLVAMARRCSAGRGAWTSPPKAALPFNSPSNHSIARLMMRIVVS